MPLFRRAAPGMARAHAYGVRTALPLLLLLVAAPASAQTIVLDPGHGGTDPGAVGCMGLEESGVVLDVAQRTQTLLEAAGLTVELTRSDDRFIALSARASFANGIPADLFVSIHSNSNAGTPATGTETFIANSASSTSELLGGNLQTEMIAAWGLRDRGLKRANFTVISTTRMPAALTELGFTNRCDPDAALLRDPAARADAAAAHARAVMITLGMDPPPTGTTGVLRGVVFEDRGAGLEDTSVRVDTARVTIDGTESAVDAGTGHFLVSLSPGSYAVLATAPGFDAATRTCAVTAGGETWCSVGLRAAGSAPADAGPFSRDAGTPSTDAGTSPPPPPVEDAGTPPPPPVDEDSGPPVDPMGPPGTDRPGDSGGCSVSTGASSTTAWWLLALAGLLWVGRRRGRRSLMALSALGVLTVGCTEAPAVTESPVLAEAPVDHGASTPFAVRDVPHLARLTHVVPIAEGLRAPVVAPDGRHIALSSPDLTELWLRTADGTLEQVAMGPRVGLRPRFEGAALRYRHPGQSPTAVPHHTIALEGLDASAVVRDTGAHVDDEHRVVLRRGGQAERVISPAGDRFIVPEVAPDGRHVVFWGMSTGLYLYRVEDGALAALGEGGHPSFDPSGRWLVHDRTSDDGHDLVGGTLFLVDLESYRRAALETDGPLAYQPSLGGGRLAYTTAEGVVAAELQLGD